MMDGWVLKAVAMMLTSQPDDYTSVLWGLLLSLAVLDSRGSTVYSLKDKSFLLLALLHEGDDLGFSFINYNDNSALYVVFI